jgi:hypothetical protein
MLAEFAVLRDPRFVAELAERLGGDVERAERGKALMLDDLRRRIDDYQRFVRWAFARQRMDRRAEWRAHRPRRLARRVPRRRGRRESRAGPSSDDPGDPSRPSGGVPL